MPITGASVWATIRETPNQVSAISAAVTPTWNASTSGLTYQGTAGARA